VSYSFNHLYVPRLNAWSDMLSPTPGRKDFRPADIVDLVLGQRLFFEDPSATQPVQSLQNSPFLSHLDLLPSGPPRLQSSPPFFDVIALPPPRQPTFHLPASPSTVGSPELAGYHALLKRVLRDFWPPFPVASGGSDRSFQMSGVPQ